MSTMLPASGGTSARLADVLPSSIASLAGEANPLGLPPVVSAVVVLADGLGAANIRARAGHARFLSSRLGKRDAIAGVFPATTAAGIATLATGRMPGEHGLVGYRVLDAAHDRVVNQLNGWDERLIPETWQRAATVFEQASARGIRAVSIGGGRYAASGFTRAVLRGSEYLSADTLADRLETALAVLSAGQPALVYVYAAELDIIAHASGWESDRWLAALETLDAELASFEKRMPRGVGLLVTADHGVIDVPARRHVFIDRDPALLDGVRHIGGDPRCLYLYVEATADRAAVLDRWRAAESGRAWVLSRDEAVEAGLFGAVDPEVLPRIGDVIVAARSGIAYYDDREQNTSSQAMIGQHGSLGEEESRVPLVRAGSYTRTP